MGKNQKRLSASPRRRSNRTESTLDALARASLRGSQPFTRAHARVCPPVAWKLDPNGRWTYVRLS